MAAYFERGPLEVERILKTLEQADLVERGIAGRYQRITDPVLAYYVLQRYSDVLEQESLAAYLTSLKADFRRRMGSLSNAVGHAAELFTIGLLTRFTVTNRSGLIIEGDHIEFDIVAGGEIRHPIT